MQYREIPRNFRQFRTEYGSYGKYKKHLEFSVYGTPWTPYGRDVRQNRLSDIRFSYSRRNCHFDTKKFGCRVYFILVQLSAPAKAKASNSKDTLNIKKWQQQLYPRHQQRNESTSETPTIAGRLSGKERTPETAEKEQQNASNITTNSRNANNKRTAARAWAKIGRPTATGGLATTGTLVKQGRRQ
jgi:hypothetical protein